MQTFRDIWDRAVDEVPCAERRNIGYDPVEAYSTARPLEDWHEDYGPVLWWFFPVSEAPWVGSPGDSDWLDDYYTHWTPLPALPMQPQK